MGEQKIQSDEPEQQTLKNPNPITILKLVWTIIKDFFKEKPGVIILSSIILIMLWGYHGNLDVLKFIIKEWSPPGESIESRKPILSWVPWDRELISFWSGAFLLVFIPILIIRFKFKHSLRDYGLAFPSKEKRLAGFMLFVTLILVSIIPFYFAAKNEDMQAVYPFYKNFTGITQFIIYEASYFPFFLAIEFIFRGYLLLGLSHNLRTPGFAETAKTSVIDFSRYAIIISMLSYTAWHLGKPLTELWGTPIWGLVAGAGVYYVRSIWPVLMAHYILNILLDALILYDLHKFPF